MKATYVMICLFVVGMFLLLPATSAIKSKNSNIKEKFSIIDLIKKILSKNKQTSSNSGNILLIILTVLLAALVYKYVSNMTPPEPE